MDDQHQFSSDRRAPSVADYLASHRVFGVLPRSAIVNLTPQIIERRYAKDQYIYHVDDPPNYVFLVRSGLVGVTKIDRSGNVRVVLIFFPNDTFGLIAVMFDVPRASTAVALCDSEVLLVRKDTFDRLHSAYPQFVSRLAFELARMLRRSEVVTARIATSSIMSRIAGFLLELAGAQPGKGAAPIAVDFLLSRQDMASALGTTRETVSRKLIRLSKMGLIEIQGQRLLIPRPDALLQVAEE